MSYTIKYTNGKTLAVVADQSVDEVSTSITLVGKNVNNYGQYVNTNFVALLENFANLLEPSSPVVGQTWFDTSEGRLKVYSTGTFKPVGAPIISTVEPSGAVRGDLWVDTTNNLLKWYDGSVWQLSAKQYSDEAGKEGWFAETIPGQPFNTDYPVTVFYSKGTPWAVMSTSTFTLNSEITDPGSFAQYFNTTTIRPGLIINSAIGAKFYGTATSADSIAGVNLDSVLRANSSATITELFDFANNNGISVGENNNIRLYVDNTATAVSVITGIVEDEPLEIRYISNASGPAQETVAIHIDSQNDRIGIFNRTPTTDLDITGDVRISGNLTVEGTQAILEVSTIKVDDKQIELAVQTTATDVGANEGGIVVQGATNKTWLYNNDDLVKGWESNVNINVAGTATSYKINDIIAVEFEGGADLKLGAAVRSAPGLQNLPILNVLTITNAVISNITTPISPLSNLVLNPSSGVVDLNSSAKIGGMSPTLDTDPDDYAVTKGYFEGRIAGALGGFSGRKPYTLNVDITDFDAVNDDIIAILDVTLPVDGFGDPYYVQPDGARCTVLCTKYEPTTATYVLSNLNTSTVRRLFDIVTGIEYTATSTTTSFINTVSSTSTLLVTDFELAGNVTISTPMPRIVRSVKLFAVIAGYWTFIEDVDTTYLTSNSGFTLGTGAKTFTVNRNSEAIYSSPTTWGGIFTTGTNVTIRETDTQVNYMQGTVTEYSGTNLTVDVTLAYNTATTSTFTSWIIRRDV